jgi:hypothetical protein
MQLCTLLACSSSIPSYVFPAVAVLLSTISTWVASRTHSTSQDALSISLDQERLLSQLTGRRTRNASPPAVRARRKRSTKETISTSRGRHPTAQTTKAGP